MTNGQCSCGAVTFEITAPPLARGYCHCTICQAYSNAPFADLAIYYKKDIARLDESLVRFNTYQKPPLVHRGQCVRCEKPAIEKVSLPLLPKLFIVPVSNIANAADLPAPTLHMFYEKRVADIEDDLPRHSGFLASQTAFAAGLVKGMLGRW